MAIYQNTIKNGVKASSIDVTGGSIDVTGDSINVTGDSIDVIGGSVCLNAEPVQPNAHAVEPNTLAVEPNAVAQEFTTLSVGLVDFPVKTPTGASDARHLSRATCAFNPTKRKPCLRPIQKTLLTTPFPIQTYIETITNTRLTIALPIARFPLHPCPNRYTASISAP